MDHLENLAGELGREGSNLNQAVKALNAIAASGAGEPGHCTSDQNPEKDTPAQRFDRIVM